MMLVGSEEAFAPLLNSLLLPLVLLSGICEPDVLVCDEVTSSLDVSVQAGIVTLLRRLRAERGLTMLFITHDLALAASISDAAVVLRGGQVVEDGPTGEVLTNPRDPYTQSLVAASA